MNCKQCNKEITDDQFFTLAMTHGKYFLVPGVMKGSFTNEQLYYCKTCAEKINLDSIKF